jgi:hypothetical protein
MHISQFWCWLGPRYSGERYGDEYDFLFLSVFGSIISYIPLFLWYKGVIAPDPDRWYAIKFGRDTSFSQVGAIRDDQPEQGSDDNSSVGAQQTTNARPDLAATIW